VVEEEEVSKLEDGAGLRKLRSSIIKGMLGLGLMDHGYGKWLWMIVMNADSSFQRRLD
jgi:hypothetical protein